MADITLDPDDPNPSVASSAAAAAAWAWAALASERAVKNDKDDASSQAIANKDASATKLPQQQPQQQVTSLLFDYHAPNGFGLLFSHSDPLHLKKSRSPFVTSAPAVADTIKSHYPIRPAPPAVVASTSASVSPSPFAPPPASAQISGPVSHLIPPPPSSSLRLTAKAKSPDTVRGHPDQMAVSGDLDADERHAGNENVTEYSSASTSRRDDGKARLGGNSTTRHLDTSSFDPPDRPRARAPSLQVCLSSRVVLLSACVYAYELCNRVHCCGPWISPIAHRHHDPLFLHGAHRRLLCFFLPRLRVPLPLVPRPTLLPQSETETPNHRRSYPSTLHRHRHRHHRHVDLAAAMRESSPRTTSKDDN